MAMPHNLRLCSLPQAQEEATWLTSDITDNLLK